LHDLESLRDPVDAIKDRPLVTRERRRAREVQLNLRLDPRLEQMTDSQLRLAPRRALHGRIVDVTPDRPTSRAIA